MLSMDVHDCIRYKKCAKTLHTSAQQYQKCNHSIRDVKSSKVAQNQIEIRSKTLLIP